MIFDSLQTGLRSRVVATLREYLQCEYKAKMKEDREFTIHNFKGASPKVPQQPNFSDCGLFALQYVESFLTKPLTDYTLPMKGLRKWFPSEVMRNKRSEIAKIIRDLAMEQNKDGKEIDFPALTFTPDSGSGYTDDEGDSEMKSATSKVHGDGYFFYNRSTQWAQMKGFDKCVVCGINFAYKEIYNRHKATYHKQKPRKSEIQNEKSKSTKPPASNLVVTLMNDEPVKEIFDKVAESGM